jgi:mono/diheme cytochrome c family protein
MSRGALPIALASVLAVALVPRAARAEDQLTLRSVKVDLPFGDRMFPNGPGVDAINNNCLACHSAGMVLNQPALPPAQWRAEVEKMRNAYKAPIDPKDVDAIVGYLAATKGAK